jgi:hypothetical protein
MFDRIRKLVSRRKPAVDTGPQWDPELFVYVKIPGDIQPLARGERFEDPLQLALDEAGLGKVTGGGSQLDTPYPDGRPRVEYCGIDIDVTDRDKARQLLMRKLVDLATPEGTELHYTKDGSMRLDRLTNGAWSEGEPRTFEHAGFGG